MTRVVTSGNGITWLNAASIFRRVSWTWRSVLGGLPSASRSLQVRTGSERSFPISIHFRKTGSTARTAIASFFGRAQQSRSASFANGRGRTDVTLLIRELVFSDLDQLLAIYSDLHASDDALPARPTLEATWHAILDDS